MSKPLIFIRYIPEGNREMSISAFRDKQLMAKIISPVRLVISREVICEFPETDNISVAGLGETAKAVTGEPTFFTYSVQANKVSELP
jgi:hypothetical protein